MSLLPLVQKVVLLLLLEVVIVVIFHFVDAFNKDVPLWLYVTIPPISGVVGFATNKIALIMTFWPLDFVGIPFLLIKDQPVGLFGWQGIIPCKAAKMASISVDLMMTKLIDIREVFDRLEPGIVIEKLRPGLQSIMNKMMDRVGREQAPLLYDALPQYVKDDLYARAMVEAPQMITGLLADMKENLEDVLDIKGMVVRKLVNEKELLIDMFQKCGAEEFVFIERSGYYFGFLFGLLQMIIFVFYDADWVLPVFGFAVGWLTNSIALKMIFLPIEKTKIGPLVLQGLFIRRQQEVCKIYAEISARNLLSSPLIWDEILFGKNVDKFEALVRRNAGRCVDRLTGVTRPIVEAALGARAELGSGYDYDEVKDRVCDQVIELLPEQLALLHDYTDKALAIQEEIESKMSALPPAEFEAVLHPVFEEDEIKLILVGALLGTGVGLFQLYVMFGMLAG